MRSRIVVNPEWKNKIEAKIKNSEQIDHIVSLAAAAKWLIWRLAYGNIPFAVYKLGLGITRITTDTEKCPCCGRPLK
jgi:hypothetical protein